MCRDMERFFITMTNWAKARAHHGTRPMALDPFEAILGEPLKGRLPNLALTVGVGSGHCRHALIGVGSTRVRLALFGINKLKSVLEHDVGNNGVDRRGLNGLEAGAELLDNVRIANMKGAKEKHQREQMREDNLAIH